MHFVERLEEKDLKTKDIHTLQINIGDECNIACKHCHVEGGPNKTNNMTEEMAKKVIELMKKFKFETVDITGGEPAMNPNFKKIVEAGVKYADHVIVRTNLVYLLEDESLADYFKEKKVHIVASLPCYTKENVDAQRGEGVFDDSIRGLKLLNEKGFGLEDDLQLDLVYNPAGAFLPPAQCGLQSDYEVELEKNFGIRFNNLLTITNMAIGRFRNTLEKDGELEEYEALLEENFNPDTLDAIMCRGQIAVRFDGEIYDCDFNEMIDLHANHYKNIDELLALDEDDLERNIAYGDHCYACTAGAGSSCGGALE